MSSRDLSALRAQAQPRLHSTWGDGALAIWCETGLRRSESIAPAASPHAAADVVPEPVAQVLHACRLAHKIEVRAPVGGRWRRAIVPGFLLGYPFAAVVLRAAQASDADRWAGPDLRALAQLAKGVESLVNQAQVVPTVVFADGYRARWKIVRNPEILSWINSVSERISFVDNDALINMVDWFADAMVRERLTERPSMPAIIAALIDPDRTLRGNHAMVERSRDFAAAAAAANVSVVLRVMEPDEVLWRLQVLVRTGDEALHPFSELPDPDLVAPVVARLLDHARRAYPPLAEAVTDTNGIDMLVTGNGLLELVDHGVPVLAERGIEVLLPKAWAKVHTEVRVLPPQPRVESASRLAMTQIGDVNIEVLVGGEPIDPAELHRLVEASSNIVHFRGRWVRAEGEALRRVAAFLARLQDQHNTNKNEVTPDTKDSLRDTLTAYVTALSSPEAQHLDITAPATLAWPIACDSDIAAELPDWFGATLRPYQTDGVRWLVGMARAGIGAVLADDMGLGKTMQILALESLERHQGQAAPSLIVAPLSLVRNWQREAHTFAPKLRTYIHHGAQRVTESAITDTLADTDLVLTTYGTLVRDAAMLARTRFRRIVIDEAQAVKNVNTQAAQAVRTIPAEHRIALTGTPVENRLEDMRGILDFCNPGMFGSAEVFRARFAAAIEGDGDAATASRLIAMAAPFILRRTKNDPQVVQLPGKLERRVDTFLTPEQAVLYQEVVRDMMEQVSGRAPEARKGVILAGLTALKQVCNHPALYASDGSALLRDGQHRSGKLAALDKILTAAGEAGEKVLIFTQYRTFGEMILPYLSRRAGEPIPFLSGTTSPRDRAALVEQFQRDDGPPLFMASLRAGGTGLTLTAANHVVHLDRWWNPAVETQATDRVHRIGQHRQVHVHTLVSPGTVEERIADVLEHKSGLAELTVGSLRVTELSDEALWDLVQLRSDSHRHAEAYAESITPAHLGHTNTKVR